VVTGRRPFLAPRGRLVDPVVFIADRPPARTNQKAQAADPAPERLSLRTILFRLEKAIWRVAASARSIVGLALPA
jgi:hypothetical protein